MQHQREPAWTGADTEADLGGGVIYGDEVSAAEPTAARRATARRLVVDLRHLSACDRTGIDSLFAADSAQGQFETAVEGGSRGLPAEIEFRGPLDSWVVRDGVQ